MAAKKSFRFGDILTVADVPDNETWPLLVFIRDDSDDTFLGVVIRASMWRIGSTWNGNYMNWRKLNESELAGLRESL